MKYSNRCWLLSTSTGYQIIKHRFASCQHDRGSRHVILGPDIQSLLPAHYHCTSFVDYSGRDGFTPTTRIQMHTEEHSTKHRYRDRRRNEHAVTAASFCGQASLLSSHQLQAAAQKSTVLGCWPTASTMHNTAPTETRDIQTLTYIYTDTSWKLHTWDCNLNLGLTTLMTVVIPNWEFSQRLSPLQYMPIIAGCLNSTVCTAPLQCWLSEWKKCMYQITSNLSCQAINLFNRMIIF